MGVRYNVCISAKLYFNVAQNYILWEPKVLLPVGFEVGKIV